MKIGHGSANSEMYAEHIIHTFGLRLVFISEFKSYVVNDMGLNNVTEIII